MLRWYIVRMAKGRVVRTMALSAEEAIMVAGALGPVVSVEVE